MSVHFRGNAADDLTVSGVPAASGAWSWGGFARWTALSGFQTAYAVENSVSSSDNIFVETNGGSPSGFEAYSDNASVLTLGSAITQDTWYFIGHSITVGSTSTLYVFNAATGALSSGTHAAAAVAATALMRLGNNAAFTELLVGDLVGVRFFTSSLSREAWDVERRTILPARRSDLWGAWPLLDVGSGKLVDVSGNGRTLTQGGSAGHTTASNPPVAYSGWRPYVLTIGASGGSSPQTVSPSLLTNAQTLYAATSSTALTTTASLLANSNTFYDATVSTSTTVSPGLLTNTQTHYDASVSTALTTTAALLTNTSDVYAPSISTALTTTASLLTNSSTLYAATASHSLSPNLLTNTQTHYDATATPGGVTVSPSLLTNAAVFYAASASVAEDASPTVLSVLVLQGAHSRVRLEGSGRSGASVTPNVARARAFKE